MRAPTSNKSKRVTAPMATEAEKIARATGERIRRAVQLVEEKGDLTVFEEVTRIIGEQAKVPAAKKPVGKPRPKGKPAAGKRKKSADAASDSSSTSTAGATPAKKAPAKKRRKAAPPPPESESESGEESSDEEYAAPKSLTPAQAKSIVYSA